MTRLRRTMTVIVAGSLGAVLVALPGAPAQALDDTTAPTISSITPVSATVQAGDPILATFVGHDDVGVYSVVATFDNGNGTTVNVMSVGGEPIPVMDPLGPITGVVPIGAPAGTYTLTYLALNDWAGNSTAYTQGSATSTPAGSPALLDLSAVKVTVTQPVQPDVTAPALTSFAMVSPTADRHPNEFATWSFGASDAMSPITRVRVFIKGPSGEIVNAGRTGGVLTSGRVSIWLPDGPSGVALGHWTVDSVQVTDSSGNMRSYTADGVGAQFGQPDLTGPTFPGMGFDLVGGPTRADDIRALDEQPEAVITTAASRTLVAAGTAISLSGTVRYLGHSVPFPAVAVYATTATGTTLLGVTRGTATGTFARRVVPTKPTVYRVLFLGSDRGGAAAPATRGAKVGVRTALPQKLLVPTRTVTVRSGHRGALVVTVSPVRTRVLVYLQRQYGSVWRNVTSARTTSRGTVTLTVARPTVATVYRWVAVYDGHYLAATSPTVTVRRG